MNLGSLFPRHAKFRPDHPALIFKDRRLSWLEYNQDINRLSNALNSLGLKKGDKVAVLLPNSVELLTIYWAAAKTGCVVVPMSTLLLAPAMLTLLNDSDSAALITTPDFAEIIDLIRPELPGIGEERFILLGGGDRPGWVGYEKLTASASEGEPVDARVGDEDLFNIMYSSGTTGLPKGIVHTHYVRSMYCFTQAAAYRMNPESVVLHAGSIVFNGAFCTLMPITYLGGTYVLLPAFDLDLFVETIKKEKVTHVMMVPSQIIAMLHHPKCSEEHLGSLEMILSLGAPLHRSHKDELQRRLPGRFYELYGLTEGFITILDKYDFPLKPDSVGVPPPLFEMFIADDKGSPLPPNQVGEIVGRGPILMPGYYKRPDLTEQAVKDGWLYSGDLGYVDEDGYLYLVDRKKDMIISGGVNVYPRDIEEIIVRHPAVREAAVFGAPSEKWGETPVAAVVLKESEKIQAEELKAWTNARVGAKFQRVSEVVIMDDFPRNAAGKTLKRVMRDDYEPSN